MKMEAVIQLVVSYGHFSAQNCTFHSLDFLDLNHVQYCQSLLQKNLTVSQVRIDYSHLDP